METLLLLARLPLAVIFCVAGLTKLADLAGSRKALRDFGLPAPLAGPLGLLLPLAELAVAVALLPTGTLALWGASGPLAWWGAIGALALLLLFLAGIGVNLARGRRPDCHCFGQLASEPIGLKTVLRNFALAAVAVFVVVAGRANPGPSAVAWLGGLSAGARVGSVLGLAALAVLAAEAWVLLQLLHQNGRMLVQIEALQAAVAGATAGAGFAAAAAAVAPSFGLPVGAPAPSFSLTGLYGETMTLEALRAGGRPLLLTFSDPNCGPCQALLPDLGRWQRELASTLTLAVISRGTADENRSKSAEHGLTQMLLQQDREVMEAYQAVGTPSAVLVRPDGSIGTALAQGAEEIRALVARSAPGNLPATLPLAPYPPPANGNGPCPQCGQYHDQPAAGGAAPAMPPGLAVGTPAPALKRADLTGNQVDLADYRGRETVVLFWNPGCGFCQQMLPDLKGWETNRPADAPALLVVSTGTAESNQAHGLMSTILLDDNFAVGGTFGASGTPSAVKVGRDGTIAAPLQVGGPGVMALLTGQPVPAAPAAAAAPPPPAIRIGEQAPEFALPDLDGNNVSLASYRGKQALLLFWNPGCGFCQQMLQDLRTWDVQRPADSPEILVVSTGAAQENRVLGLRSTIVLDAGMSTGQRFGAMGTPMAVLVDAEGRVASETAAGAEAVLALARGGGAK